MRSAIAAVILLPTTAFAQAVTVTPAPTVDLTGIATTVIAGIFGVLGVVIPLWLRQRINNADDAAAVAKAVQNALGAIPQAATTGVTTLRPNVPLPAGTPPGVAVGVQYVLDHAGDEAARIGVTPAAIASKVVAQMGLAQIAANTAAQVPGLAVPLVAQATVAAAPPAAVVPIAPVVPTPQPGPVP